MNLLLITTPGEPVTVANAVHIDIKDGALWIFGAGPSAGDDPKPTLALILLLAAGQWRTVNPARVPDHSPEALQ